MEASSPASPRASHRRRLLLLLAPQRLPDPRGEPDCGGQSENCMQLLEERNINLQRTTSSDSTDSGCCLDSPSFLGMKDLDDTFRLPVQRMHSIPQSLLGCSPALKRSHSDVLGCSTFQACTSEENKENEPFEFKKPMRPASRSSLLNSPLDGEQDVLGCRQKSAPGFMFPSSHSENNRGKYSPVCLRQLSLKAHETEEEDDGFLEIMDGQDVSNDEEMPLGVASLWTAPLVMKTRQDGQNKRCRLLGAESEPYSMAKAALKRMERSQEENSPGAGKKRKSAGGAPSEELTDQALVGTPPSTEIENILDCGQRDLIGDFSKGYLFHTVDGKHQDLKYIDPDMIVAVLNGSFTRFLKECVIIDCRYPYEYEGGHIKGAVNLHMEEEVEDFLLKKPIVSSDHRRVIIVFHCEFSSERGPRMCRFVRERDRLANEYPILHYPELYVLKGGYKDFFSRCRSYCEPQGYRPMHHEDFREDLRKFRTKSRTWAGEKSKRELYSRLKKL
ncbi:M-phase inducer phosphatase 1 isoform X1 [Paroedura picta]|uniref:M-phase inducer phosphatase 1 isoform X1 n=1 Tax=Paroedura picta TaxID=143630 RepID=UPI00405611BE